MKRILLVTALAVTTGACSVQMMGTPKGGLEFEAEFADVRIGTVTGIRLGADFRARVKMQLEPERRLPQGVTAMVARTSLLGENYIKVVLPPGKTMDSTPSLAGNALITQTSVQPDLESISEKVGPVLAALGGQDLGRIVDAAVKDKGLQLNSLIKQVTDISGSYAAAAKDLQTTIDGMARLGDALESKSSEIDRLPGRLVVATDRIERDRKELKQAVRDLVELGESFNSTVHTRHAARLKSLLRELDRIVDAMLRGKKTLKTLVQNLNSGFLAAPSLTYKSQGLMQAWMAGFLDLDADPAHVTANGGRGEDVDLSEVAHRALSPVLKKDG